MATNFATELSASDALLIVDVQRDFCPGGALAVPSGDEVVPVLNSWIERARQAGALVIASRDWHPPDHASFSSQGGPWPAHCVQGTPGAELHPDLELPPATTVVSCGIGPQDEGYSVFDKTDLAARLEEHGVHRLFVGGLALDVCVRASVLDALRHGFETHVIVEGTRAIDEAEGVAALREMLAGGAVLEPPRGIGGAA